MKPFDFISPNSVGEAVDLLHQYGDRAVIIAGGTDLTLLLNERKLSPELVINIKNIKELDYIRLEEDIFHIGALTTHAELAGDERILQNVKILYAAAKSIGSPQIRNMGTVGGNIVQSSVAADILAAFTVLNASVKLRSASGERILKLEEFLKGGGEKRNALSEDELLTEIFFKAPDPKHTATAFYKLAKRKSLAISVIAGCLYLSVDDDGICTEALLSGGALSRYPLRFTEAEEFLVGKSLSMDILEKTLPMLHDKVLEVNSNRPWSVSYKKESVQGVFRKLFRDALSQL